MSNKNPVARAETIMTFQISPYVTVQGTVGDLAKAGVGQLSGAFNFDLPPEKEGFFWGRWHTPAPGTTDDGEPCSGDEWEVHHVFRNHYNEEAHDRFRVMVPGVEKTQSLDSFEWGAEVLRK